MKNRALIPDARAFAEVWSDGDFVQPMRARLAPCCDLPDHAGHSTYKELFGIYGGAVSGPRWSVRSDGRPALSWMLPTLRV